MININNNHVNFLFRTENRDILSKICSNLNDVQYSRLREVSKAANDILSKTQRNIKIREAVAKYDEIEVNNDDRIEISSENLKFLPGYQQNRDFYMLEVGLDNSENLNINEYNLVKSNDLDSFSAIVDLHISHSLNPKNCKVLISVQEDETISQKSLVLDKFREMLSISSRLD